MGHRERMNRIDEHFIIATTEQVAEGLIKAGIESISVDELLAEYRNHLDFKNSDHRGNFKFVMHYIKKHKNNFRECVWFLKEAIDLHKRTTGSEDVKYGYFS